MSPPVPARRSGVWWAETLWTPLLTVLVLAPTLLPPWRGFVLSYDMVWVPDLAVRSDVLGLGSGLPRAVPSDAWVAVLDEAVPGALLQRLVLVGALLLAGYGARRLVPLDLPCAAAGRLLASTVMIWNPLVAERLAMGHWPLLLAYGALPWLLAGARSGRWPSLFAGLVLGGLSAAGGVLTGVVTLLAAARAGRGRAVRVAGLVLLANSPWLVAGLVHAGQAHTGGTSAFALRGEGDLPSLLTAVGLGGVWNAEVVPGSRDGLNAVCALGLLVAAGLLSARAWWQHTRAGLGPLLLIGWCLGLGLAALGVVAPDGVAWIAGHVPGGGVLRDGSRALVLCVPLLASLLGTGLACGLGRLHDHSARLGLTLVAVLVPVVLLPDLAWGVGGQLRPASYPSAYAEARTALDQAGASDHGAAVYLPFTSYRAPAWNRHRAVLDPLPRYLAVAPVVNDALVVGRERIRGEDPRARRVAAALERPDPRARARALGRLGIGWVVEELDAPGDRSAVAGRVLVADQTLRVRRLEGPVLTRTSNAPARLALGATWAAYVLGVLAALVAGCRLLARSRADRRGGTPRSFVG